MPMTLTTLAERPELEAQIPQLHGENWPAFVQADAVAVRYWGEMFTVFAEYQFLLCDENDQLIAAGHALPLYWDGSIAGLPTGFDGALENGFSDYTNGIIPNVLCGVSIVIAANTQGQGLSEMMIRAMKNSAELDGLGQVILPVRPSQKSRHPHVPFAEYITWQRDDGLPFDPWLRVHHRLGSEILVIAPQSMVVTGTIPQWVEWTGMEFPTSGAYPVVGALVPVVIDHDNNTGLYEEPNVWLRYVMNA